MIPSVDTYLYDEIDNKLKIILSNRYIMKELLKEIQPNVVRNFIRAYCGDKGRDIPIVYTIPQDRNTQQGAIYIGLREGQESAPSVGGIEDLYDFRDDGLIKHTSIVETDGDRLYLEVDKEIGELNNIENITFSASDNVTVEGNRIYFAYDPSLVGLEFKVNYLSKEDHAPEKGLKKGFTATESYSILSISTNMDTVRCIDQLVKAILIMMRDNPQEKTSILLQSLKYSQIEEIDIQKEQDRENPIILYGRETIVSYAVSYSLDVPILDELEKINLNIRSEVKEE